MNDGYAGSTVWVYREPAYSMAAIEFIVRIDGVEAGRVKPNEKVPFTVAPGTHRIQISTWTRQGSGTLDFTVQPGQAVGFVCKGTLRPLRPVDLDRHDGVASGAATAPAPAPAAPRYGSPAAYGTTPPVWAGAAPTAQPAPAPQQPSQQPARVEVIETDQFEEHLGEEARVIDNRHSATGVTRSVRASREWSRTLSIGSDQTRTYGGEIGGGVAWLKVKGNVEQELKRSYSTEIATKQEFSEEITITVPERTSVRLVLRWKRIWQRGVVRVTEPDGVVYDVPFQVVVNITFDQLQHDAEDGPAEPAPTMRLEWRPPTSAQ